ncbi:MAG: putative 60 kDa inner rane insertion protein [Candidatus Saccharibacteria bacterium]|nr:putative 60 kDa inner rane insertion protein [Candidatus Saccharibacteria bacterium]
MNIFELLIVQPLFNLLMLLYAVIPGGDFGLSIVLFTIILRLAMYPLVKRQLHQTKAMRRLQPELEEIKKRTKGNRQAQGVEMMELYKRHGVSPFRSIGILIIQLPIFISLYSVIQIFTLHRDQLTKWTYDFIENIGPIKHIIEHPSAFNEKFLGVVDLTQHAFSATGVNGILVVLALVAAIGQFIQSKQTLPQATGQRRLRDILSDAANGKDADQSDINNAIMGKMIYVLPLFMLFIMLSLPGAIALYYATSTLVAVIQQSIILRDDETELEEIADEHPKATPKKATAKAQARAAVAQEATVTRIVAKGANPSKPKQRSKKGKR